MKNTEIIAVHGWGFDRQFWAPWKKMLDSSVRLSCYDRGYFDRPASPLFKGDKEAQLLFVHSFGLHLCEEDLFEEADLLVIYGGFRKFHPQAAQFRNRSRQILRQMIIRFSEAPEEVLAKFRENAFQPEEPASYSYESMNRKLLLEDLQRLDRSSLSVQLLQKPREICILHGAADSIVPNAKGRELHSLAGSRSRYLEAKQAGHALPVTHAAQCSGFIEPILEAI
jgi:pimeloyl-[acyl-carrier protein] methyl ester esterase